MNRSYNEVQILSDYRHPNGDYRYINIPHETLEAASWDFIRNDLFNVYQLNDRTIIATQKTIPNITSLIQNKKLDKNYNVWSKNNRVTVTVTSILQYIKNKKVAVRTSGKDDRIYIQAI